MTASDPRGARTGRSPLIALGSAAVIAVYAAGYLRTRDVAVALELEVAARRAAGRDRPESLSAANPLAEVRVLMDSAAAAGQRPSGPRTGLQTDDSSRFPAAGSKPRRQPKPVATAETTATGGAPQIPAPPDSTPKPQVPVIPEYVPPSAPAKLAADTAAAAPRVIKPLRDGAFYGYGSSRHGDLEVRLEINSGKIVYAEISKCMTRWPCTWIEKLPGQVIERQTADVDVVSGATVSSDAFYMAVMDALSASRGK